LVGAGVEVCALGGRARVTELDSGLGRNVVVPSSVLFPWLATTLAVTHVDCGHFNSFTLTNRRLPQTEFTVMFKSLIHHAFYFVHYFRQFHLNQVRN
jgi:hypothetical protein